MFGTRLVAAGLAALVLAASAGAALAAPARVTANVNVRSGPGTGYGVIDVLRAGERVDVEQCRGSWCLVSKAGPDGWVSASYLSTGGGYVRPPVVVRPPIVVTPPPIYYPRPPIYRPPFYGRPPYHGRPPYNGGHHHRPHGGWDR